MKTSLSLLFAYFAVCIFGTAVGASLYMMYGDLTLFVAGQPLSSFTADLFIRGVFFVCPLVCVFSSLLLVLYLVRHPSKNVLPIIFYIFTGLISWGVIIPFTMQKASVYESKPLEQKKAPPLTAGFFREDSGGIYYYSRVGMDGTGDGLYIDLQGFTGEQGKIIPFENAPINKNSAYPFSDLLIRDSAALPHFLQVPIDLYKKQLVVAKKAIKNGYISWLCFASVGVALLAVVALKKISLWRLLSACISVVVFIVISGINCACYGSGALSQTVMKYGLWWQEICKSFPSWLSWTAKIQSPFVVILNLCICICVVVVGVVSVAIKKHVPSDEEENA